MIRKKKTDEKCHGKTINKRMESRDENKGTKKIVPIQ